jgi:hypothetical protein
MWYKVISIHKKTSAREVNMNYFTLCDKSSPHGLGVAPFSSLLAVIALSKVEGLLDGSQSQFSPHLSRLRLSVCLLYRICNPESSGHKNLYFAADGLIEDTAEGTREGTSVGTGGSVKLSGPIGLKKLNSILNVKKSRNVITVPTIPLIINEPVCHLFSGLTLLIIS